MKTNPFKAVSFSQNAVSEALARCGYLIADTKYDGVRGNICVDNTANGLWLSRVGKTIPALEHLNGFDSRWQRMLKDDRCIYPEGFMLDGELMVKATDFNTGSGILRTKWTKANNFAFHRDVDRIPFCRDRKGKLSVKGQHPFELDPQQLKVVLYAIVPLHIVESGEDHPVMNLLMPLHVAAMVNVLKEYFPEIDWCLSESRDVYDMEELNALYEQRRAEGNEGLVVKDPQGIYKRGKKTGWWKMKPENEADGVITGLVWGTEGLANEGKVIGFEVLLESGRVVNATNISRALMDEFTQKVLDNGDPHFKISHHHRQPDSTWENPYQGWQCQISYMEETPDGSLRHPSFDKFRGTEENPKEKM